jgi:catechol 2,3-dioxygenase-like lactoylglutathione lyase family enzyme
MQVTGLNHINLTAPDALLEEVRRFYEIVLGLSVGQRPEFSRPGYWLYAGGSPIVHLSSSESEVAIRDGRGHYLDHVAFTCMHEEATAERLESMGVRFDRRTRKDSGFTQLFLTDPAGLRIELNFEDRVEQA